MDSSSKNQKRFDDPTMIILEADATRQPLFIMLPIAFRRHGLEV